MKIETVQMEKLRLVHTHVTYIHAIVSAKENILN